MQRQRVCCYNCNRVGRYVLLLLLRENEPPRVCGLACSSRCPGTRREAAMRYDLTTERRPLESPCSQTTSCTTQPFQTRRKPNLESPSVCLVARSTGFSFEWRTRHAGRDIFRLRWPRMAGAWQGARKDRLNLTGFVSAGKTTGFLSRGPWFYFSSFFFCWRCPRLVFGGALPLSLFSFSF